jgi:tRNA(Ile)-lysidine synthase TilS/MesJ
VSRGINRLALGHHLDDAIETFFLNLFFQRRLDALKPATPTDHGVTVIRPLLLVEENQVIAWRDTHGVEPVPCPVCDTFPASKRRAMGVLLETMRAEHPELSKSVRRALYG